MDGWNSVVRYIKNNFQDGYRQVCQLRALGFNLLLLFIIYF